MRYPGCCSGAVWRRILTEQQHSSQYKTIRITIAATRPIISLFRVLFLVWYSHGCMLMAAGSECGVLDSECNAYCRVITVNGTAYKRYHRGHG